MEKPTADSQIRSRMVSFAAFSPQKNFSSHRLCSLKLNRRRNSFCFVQLPFCTSELMETLATFSVVPWCIGVTTLEKSKRNGVSDPSQKWFVASLHTIMCSIKKVWSNQLHWFTIKTRFEKKKNYKKFHVIFANLASSLVEIMWPIILGESIQLFFLPQSAPYIWRNRTSMMSRHL